ncbi:MAG: phosphatase PAP2 family protein [Burkholderiaceae bacterium]
MTEPGIKPIAWLPLGVVVVVLIGAATLFMTVGTANVETFIAVQRLTRPLPDTFWAMVTICGTGVVTFSLLSPTLRSRPRWYAAGLASAAMAGLYANGLKRLFALPRPASVLDASQLHVIGDTLHANSFPSGHSVTAFTLAAIVVFASRTPLRAAAWAVPLALLVAVSRIAVGAHWPADLAAGAAGGWVCGALGVMVVMRWRVWNTINGLRVMGLVSIGVGISLCIVDLGYPLAIPLQRVAAVVAIVAGGATVLWPRLDPLLPWTRAVE